MPLTAVGFAAGRGKATIRINDAAGRGCEALPGLWGDLSLTFGMHMRCEAID